MAHTLQHANQLIPHTFHLTGTHASADDDHIPYVSGVLADFGAGALDGVTEGVGRFEGFEEDAVGKVLGEGVGDGSEEGGFGV